jgi:hypothetical protein
MKRLILVAVGCLIIGEAGYAGNGLIVTKTNAISGRYMVMVNSNADVYPVRDYAIQLGGSVDAVWADALFGFALQSSVAVATTLSNDSRVTVVEQDDYVQPQQSSISAPHNMCPVTQTYPSQSCADGSIPWQLDAMDSSQGYGGINQLDDRYRYQYTGYGVRIYIVDSGIYGHPDIADRIESGVNLTNDTNGGTANDLTYHGTNCAGFAAGTKVGPAKDAVLVPVRFYKDDNPPASASQLATAINWVSIDMGTRIPAKSVVVNISYRYGISSVLDKAVLAVVSKGAVVTTAAGNDGQDACGYSPQHLSQVITVGGLQRTFNSGNPKYAISPTSGVGSCVTLMAPSDAIGGIHSTASYNCNPGWSATSYATAFVSGIAALYLEAYPGSSPSEIKQLMLNNANYDFIAGSMHGAPMILVQPPAEWPTMDCNAQCILHCGVQ